MPLWIYLSFAVSASAIHSLLVEALQPSGLPTFQRQPWKIHSCLRMPPRRVTPSERAASIALKRKRFPLHSKVLSIINSIIGVSNELRMPHGRRRPTQAVPMHKMTNAAGNFASKEMTVSFSLRSD
jgi:hypothetical protein